jgi:hypothetical protein
VRSPPISISIDLVGHPDLVRGLPAVEGMSDGWDDASTYGHVHSLPMPDSAGGGAFTSLRLVARNSGLFYLAATKQCLRLTKILANRMAHEQARPPAISPCLA